MGWFDAWKAEIDFEFIFVDCNWLCQPLDDADDWGEDDVSCKNSGMQDPKYKHEYLEKSLPCTIGSNTASMLTSISSPRDAAKSV